MADTQKHVPPPCVTMPNLVILGQTSLVYVRVSARKAGPLCRPLQGHSKISGTDTDQSATYDFLLVIHSTRWACLVPFPRYMAILVKKCNFLMPCWGGNSRWNFVTSVMLEKLEGCPTRCSKSFDYMSIHLPTKYQCSMDREIDTAWNQ